MHGTHNRGLRRVAAVVLVTVGALFLVNLARLVLANERATRVEASMATAESNEEAAVAALETETARAYTDAYAEEYVREQYGWSRPGDRLMIPAPVGSANTGAAPADDGASPSLLDRVRQWFSRDDAEPADAGVIVEPSVGDAAPPVDDAGGAGPPVDDAPTSEPTP